METCSSKNNKCVEPEPRNTADPGQPGCPKTRTDKPSKPSPSVCIREGWKLQWTLPRGNLFVRAVVPGPFVRPRLVRALPYVVVSSCKHCGGNGGTSDPLRRLRNGIPDPWLEYLTWKESESDGNGCEMRDVRLSREYQRYTDRLWTRKRLTMMQGIPDPWRVGVFCTCKDEVDLKKKKENNKKKKPRVQELNKDKIKDIAQIIPKAVKMDKIQVKKIPKAVKTDKIDVKKIPKAVKIDKIYVKKISKAVKIDKIDVNSKRISNKTVKNLKSVNGFEQIKKKLTEFDTELKLKDAIKVKKMREVEKITKLKPKEQRKINRKSKNYRHSNIPEVACFTDNIPKVSTNEKRDTEALMSVKDQKKHNKGNSLTQKENKKPDDKTEESKRKKQPASRESASCSFSPCGGKCGRISVTEENIKNSEYLESDSCSCLNIEYSRPFSANTNISPEDLKNFLREINSRIKITKDVLKSPDMSSEAVKPFDDEHSNNESLKTDLPKNSKNQERKVPPRKSPGPPRERGGKDQTINHPESDLFFRRSPSNFRIEEENNILITKDNKVSKHTEQAANNFEASEIPDFDIIAASDPCYLKYCYQTNSLQNRNSVASANEEQLILESFSDVEE